MHACTYKSYMQAHSETLSTGCPHMRARAQMALTKYDNSSMRICICADWLDYCTHNNKCQVKYAHRASVHASGMREYAIKAACSAHEVVAVAAAGRCVRAHSAAAVHGAGRSVYLSHCVSSCRASNCHRNLVSAPARFTTVTSIPG